MYQFLIVLLGLSLCSSQDITAKIRSVEDVTITIELSNSAEVSVALLRWNLPLDNRFESDSFRVLLDGAPVRYIGPRVKYAGPFIDDYVFIAPNETKVFKVSLENAYDFSQPGEYDVVFVADVLDYQTDSAFHSLPHTKDAFTPYSGVISNSLKFTTTKGFLQKLLRAPYPCSSSEKSTIDSAYTTQRTMIGYANTRIKNGNSAEYRMWFGAHDTTRHTHVATVITRIVNNNKVAFQCDNMANVYAYVYPTDSTHTIYMCSAFWRAPMAGGHDTKAGTVIHELSHFNSIGATNDWVYGTSAARNLATSNPARATTNADNYEYFCESEW